MNLSLLRAGDNPGDILAARIAFAIQCAGVIAVAIILMVIL